jgi:hypothetical protein
MKVRVLRAQNVEYEESGQRANSEQPGENSYGRFQDLVAFPFHDEVGELMSAIEEKLVRHARGDANDVSW